ncbi:HNH endonuclease [Burkholderia phage BcepMigl]|uniref:Uncharacterized protein n=1 Tax=Burkholderia phage BcepMigl TaxID=2886899 RepID=I6WLM5_9CAUD|nr:HNH endonuclease [Burkholderia phage BcepMigl]AFN39083.1 hypothetical protein BcepMigl_gp14 [Burkholderia phage BcepMigl]
MAFNVASDHIGKRIGRLTVLARAANDGTQSAWFCACDCGNFVIKNSTYLRRGKLVSCGCAYRDSKVGKPFYETHRMSGHPLYKTWTAMKQRCENPNARGYDDYGGRGIRVCERWQTFENFLADMGERPEGMTLDRFPGVNGNYEPGNCRWATKAEQSRNTRVNISITIDGETKVLADWCRQFGVKYTTVYCRITKQNMTPVEALTKEAA